jgi:hypothetical protein
VVWAEEGSIDSGVIFARETGFGVDDGATSTGNRSADDVPDDAAQAGAVILTSNRGLVATSPENWSAAIASRECIP